MPTKTPSTVAPDERADNDAVGSKTDQKADTEVGGKNKDTDKAPGRDGAGEQADEAPSNRRMIRGTNNGQPDALDTGDNGDAYNP